MSRNQSITEPPAARAAAARRGNARRARNWREARKENGVPLPRDVDKAVCEALAFLMARHKRDGVNIGEPDPVSGRRRVEAIDPADIAIMSAFILEREGFAAEPARAAVKVRLKPRDQHGDADFMPSLEPGPLEWMRGGKGNGWSTPPHVIYDFMKGRSPSSS